MNWEKLNDIASPDNIGSIAVLGSATMIKLVGDRHPSE